MSWLSGLAAVASTAYNAFSQDSNRQKDEAFAREMAQYQNDIGVQNWQMQNNYNSPEAQISRLRAAGLNPNLAYGSLSNEATTPQAGAGQAPSRSSPYYIDPLTMSQIELNNAQAKSINHDTDREDEKQPFALQQLQSSIDNLNKDLEVKSSQISSMNVDDQLKYAQIADYEFQHAMQEKEYQLAADRAVAEINKINSEININRQTYDEMVKTASARALGYDLNNELIRKQIGLTEKQIQQADKNIQLLGFEVSAGSIENDQNVRAYENYQNRKGSRIANDVLYTIGRLTSSLRFRVGLK